MKIIITGSLGLIGYTCACEFLKLGYNVIGIDNDSRKKFFGKEASVKNNLYKLREFPKYNHHWLDITEEKKVNNFFRKNCEGVTAIIHCAAQPSHDWAYKDPVLDSKINAFATLYLMVNIKKYCPNAFVIYMSTNKVYGDNPNKLLLKEMEERYDHFGDFHNGISENFKIDSCIHSIFGVNKLYSDLIVQEYGKNLGIKSCVLRCGCLTGENHKGAKMHGFLSYLAKCVKENIEYNIFGYKGKQVRDNIHSFDVWNCINNIINGPNIYGEVFNLGGGRENSISIIEAIKKFEICFDKKLKFSIEEKNRIGDHIWYISDLSKIKKIYPNWNIQYSIEKIIENFK